MLARGDVLVSTVRPNLNAVAVVDDGLDGAIASTGFCVLRPTMEVHGRYLFHWVRSSRFVAEMVRRATGASYPAVTAGIVRESRIPLPPADTQRRIARVLDVVDEVRFKRREAVAHVDSLLRSVFHETFLVSEDRYRWPRMSLDELLERIDSGNSPVCASRPARPGEWGVLKLGAISFGRYNPAENKALLPGTSPRSRDEVQGGDILVARKNTRELVGASVLVRATAARLLLPDLIFRLVPRADVPLEPAYLHAVLAQASTRGVMSRLAGGSAGSMPNISKTRLRTLEIEVPPVEMQRRYSKFVERVDRIRDAMVVHLAGLNGLCASLQSRAFRGELWRE